MARITRKRVLSVIRAIFSCNPIAGIGRGAANNVLPAAIAGDGQGQCPEVREEPYRA